MIEVFAVVTKFDIGNESKCQLKSFYCVVSNTT